MIVSTSLIMKSKSPCCGTQHRTHLHMNDIKPSDCRCGFYNIKENALLQIFGMSLPIPILQSLETFYILSSFRVIYEAATTNN